VVGCVGVLGRVVLSGFFGVLFRLHVMAVRQMGVVAGCFVFARFVVLGRGEMMLRRLLMMLGCLTVMFRALFGHGFLAFDVGCRTPGSVQVLSIAGPGYTTIADAFQMWLPTQTQPKRATAHGQASASLRFCAAATPQVTAYRRTGEACSGELAAASTSAGTNTTRALFSG
jgi:hypothetical protein